MLLEVSPNVLGRIQLGRVCGKVESRDLALQAGQIILHQTAAVSRQAVPDEQDRLIDLFVQMTDEVEHFLSLPIVPSYRRK